MAFDTTSYLKETKAKPDEIRSTSDSVLAIVHNWLNEFERGRTSTKAEHHSGRSILEMIDKIQDMVLNDQQIRM